MQIRDACSPQFENGPSKPCSFTIRCRSIELSINRRWWPTLINNNKTSQYPRTLPPRRISLCPRSNPRFSLSTSDNEFTLLERLSSISRFPQNSYGRENRKFVNPFWTFNFVGWLRCDLEFWREWKILEVDVHLKYLIRDYKSVFQDQSSLLRCFARYTAFRKSVIRWICFESRLLFINLWHIELATAVSMISKFSEL